MFVKINNEPLVQVEDMTRIDISSSFTTSQNDEITTYEIDPDSSGNFIDVTENKYLDWAYSSSGSMSIEARITTASGATYSKSSEIEVITEENDCLLSGDSDLVCLEPEIRCYIPNGRCSFLDVHRCARDMILDYLADQRIFKSEGCDEYGNPKFSKIEAQDINDKAHFNKWSTYLTLMMIYDGIWNQVDDVFYVKARRYEGLMESARNKGALHFDTDGDGVADRKVDLLVRRLSR